MAELIDIYDENTKRIGTKSRRQVHIDGDWHKVFHCWVVYRDDDGQDWVIVQKRSDSKDTFPNKLDVSAAGHYEAGESPREGMRELAEELGLETAFEQLIPLGTRMTTSYQGGIIDREVADVYMYICDQPLAEYNYQTEEVSGLIAVNVVRGLQLFTGETLSIDVPCVGFDQETITVSLDDFIPCIDFYWEKIFVLASRCLNGEKYLWV